MGQLSACLPACLPACLSVCLSLSLCVSLSLSLSRDTRDMVCYIRTSTVKIEKIDMPYRGVT